MVTCATDAEFLQRLDVIIDWFKDCHAVQETVDNMNRELDALGLVAHLEDRVMVIRRKPTVRPAKPRMRVNRTRSTGAIQCQLHG